MKEIKAYIRHEKTQTVVQALEKAGAPWITAVKADEVGMRVDLEQGEYSIEYAEKIYPLTKVEIVCCDREAEKLINILREEAWSDRRGDGIIFVHNVNEAIRIRTGERGERALLCADEK